MPNTRERTTRCPPPQYNCPTGEWSDLPLALDTAQVCNILRCTEETAVKRLREGQLRGRQSAKGYIFDRESVREYVTGEPRRASALPPTEVLMKFESVMLSLYSELSTAALSDERFTDWLRQRGCG